MFSIAVLRVHFTADFSGQRLVLLIGADGAELMAAAVLECEDQTGAFASIRHSHEVMAKIIDFHLLIG